MLGLKIDFSKNSAIKGRSTGDEIDSSIRAICITLVDIFFFNFDLYRP
jgi:hypothetical protein